MSDEHELGECEGCGKNPRVLTRLESGQGVCRTCLRELRPPRPKHMATRDQIKWARDHGFHTDENTNKDQIRVYRKIEKARKAGVPVGNDATEAQADAALAMRPDTLETNVVGVTFRNPDGSDRQSIIAQCRKGEPLLLAREPGNKHDPQAVKVMRASGTQLGYLSREVVRGAYCCSMADYLDGGGACEVVLSKIYGGEYVGPERIPFGVEISITYYPYSISWGGK